MMWSFIFWLIPLLAIRRRTCLVGGGLFAPSLLDNRSPEFFDAYLELLHNHQAKVTTTCNTVVDRSHSNAEVRRRLSNYHMKSFHIMGQQLQCWEVRSITDFFIARGGELQGFRYWDRNDFRLSHAPILSYENPNNSEAIWTQGLLRETTLNYFQIYKVTGHSIGNQLSRELKPIYKLRTEPQVFSWSGTAYVPQAVTGFDLNTGVVYVADGLVGPHYVSCDFDTPVRFSGKSISMESIDTKSALLDLAPASGNVYNGFATLPPSGILREPLISITALSDVTLEEYNPTILNPRSPSLLDL
jgi:hypothetical protein